MKRRIMICSVAVLILASVSVQADVGVWTFDELPPITSFGSALIPNGYGGFNWGNMGYTNPAFHPIISGYMAGIVSQPNVAYNQGAFPATVSSSSLFDFGGAYLTGAWNDGLNIQVDGYLDSTQLYTQTVVVSSTAPTWFDFSYDGIDRLVFSSWGGTQNPDYSGFSTYFVMDNFTVVPVPGAILLGMLGLSAVGIKLRKFA